MKGIPERLEMDLLRMVSRLRPGPEAEPDEVSGTGVGRHADEGDERVTSEEREVRFGTRELLRARVNRTRAALERLNDGEYGTCVECGNPISPARLQAMPEVETCVPCQERLERRERRGHQLQSVGVHGDGDEDSFRARNWTIAARPVRNSARLRQTLSRV
jgi:RNA polymerase-binding transcription factor